VREFRSQGSVRGGGGLLERAVPTVNLCYLLIKQGIESQHTSLFSCRMEKDAEKGHSERSEESIFVRRTWREPRR
jgi:hypothetical protein